MKKAVHDIEEKDENVIFVNAGDFFQGNAWYTMFKSEAVTQFANILDFTAMVNYRTWI